MAASAASSRITADNGGARPVERRAMDIDLGSGNDACRHGLALGQRDRALVEAGIAERGGDVRCTAIGRGELARSHRIVDDFADIDCPANLRCKAGDGFELAAFAVEDLADKELVAGYRLDDEVGVVLGAVLRIAGDIDEAADLVARAPITGARDDALAVFSAEVDRQIFFDTR